MPRFRHILNKFTGGEVSPEVWGRTETNEWPAMLEKARNVILNPRGGALRRPGLHHVCPTKFPEGKSRLIPFVFSDTQSYILEFGDFYVRFFRDEGWVEDIGNVKSYLGDGTSTSFVYPYPDTLEADIEVYDETGTLVPIGDATLGYTVTAISPGTNYAPAFSDANWKVDIDSSGNPWVKNLATIASPSGYTTVMGLDDAQVPIGGAYKYTVDVVSASYSVENTVDSNTSVIPLVDGDPYIEIANAVILDTVTTNVNIASQCHFEDTSGTGNTDFFWEVRHNDDIIAEGVELAVQTPGALLSDSSQIPTGVSAGDTISLHVRCIENSPGSTPQITGTTNPTSVSVQYTINSDAKLNYAIRDALGEVAYKEIEAVVGTLTLLDSTETNTVPAPLDFLFSAQRGLDVTLENPVLEFNNEGWIIEFNNAPAVGTIRTIVDKSKTEQTKGNHIGRNSAVRASKDIFEIQSPYSEDHLEELYFAQANDVLLICHDLYKPRELTRYNPYDWRFEQNEFTGAEWEAPGYNPLDGYPRTCAYYQERLYFGGTVAKPQTLWGSRAADFHEFTPDITDPLPPDAPVTYTIAAYTHEAIEWLSSERVLVIGTSATEHRLAPDQYVATDRLPTVSRMSAYGGAHIMPAFMGNLTVFVQTGGNQVRTFEQSGQTVIEKWDSLELDWKAKHLTEPKVKQITYALNPYSILVMVTLDGDMLTMTYEPNAGETSEVGWTLLNTDGKFVSCAVIPESIEIRQGHLVDQIWTIVERNINGRNLKYVEYFDERVHQDSVLTYPDRDFPDDPPIQSVGGLDHLEGKEVTIVADGSTHPDLIVTNGRVELNDEYQNIKIGLKYIPEIKLQRLALAGEQANLQGQLGRWSEVWLRMVNSAYPLVDGVRAAERRPSSPRGDVEEYVTGDVKVYHLGWDRNKQLTITQDLPVPMHITAIYGVVSSNSG
jgi:hypothetical protein